MTSTDRKRVSFPVTVWFDRETGRYQITWPTRSGVRVSVGADPRAADGHPQLYSALRTALRDRGEGFEEAPERFN